MRYIVSADDIGLSQGITDGILEAFDKGYLNGTSIVANGTAYDYAVAECAKRPGLRLTVHINLVEGKPLCWPGDVDLLVDRSGRLCRSFVSLLLASVHASAPYRHRLKQQIKREISAQIARVGGSLGTKTGLRIDGHRHYQMIPIVFDALMELHDYYRFSYLRTLDEPFFLLDGRRLSPRNHCGPNLIKHALLKALSQRPKRVLRDKGIEHCDNFVGLLFSGSMSERAVASALAAIEKMRAPGSITEFLLHPGAARSGEEAIWESRPALGRYYFDAGRARERATLTSPSFRAMFEARLEAEDSADEG